MCRTLVQNSTKIGQQIWNNSVHGHFSLYVKYDSHSAETISENIFLDTSCTEFCPTRKQYVTKQDIFNPLTPNDL
jgi:hypothetical protein